MPKKIIVSIFIVLLFLLIVPQIVNAGLVPCGRECLMWKDESGVEKPGTQCLIPGMEPDGSCIPYDEAQPCTLCHIFKMFQRLLDGIGLVILGWAALFAVIGAITIITAAGSADKISKGKKIITYAFIGVLIAFGAWLIINETMVLLVGRGTGEGAQKMPWAWNKIKCEPLHPEQPSEYEGVCTLPEGPIKPPESEGEYCVCEVPVYDLDPNQHPNKASVIGTNIKVSKLADKNTCEQNCVSGNFGNYCPSTLKSDQAKLYCTDESGVKSKRTCGVKFTTQETSIDCQISNECFATDLDCAAVVTPTFPAFNKNYAQKCFVNGEDLCNYRVLKGGDTYCPDKYSSPCASADRKLALYRWRSEISEFEKNAYDCSRNAYGNTGIACRLDCQYDKVCRKPETNWCNDLTTYSCFGGKFSCKNMMRVGQEGSASEELKDFLACMSRKMPAEVPRIITSVVDNSKSKCLDLDYWDKKGQCTGAGDKWDSCTGNCCGHSRSSLHYGGTQGSTDCRKYSFAVDFGNETVSYLDQVKKTAKDCGKELWNGTVRGVYLGEVYVQSEGDHIHIQLDGIAKYHGCK